MDESAVSEMTSLNLMISWMKRLLMESGPTKNEISNITLFFKLLSYRSIILSCRDRSKHTLARCSCSGLMLEGITDLYKMEEITALKAEKSSKFTVDISSLRKKSLATKI